MSQTFILKISRTPYYSSSWDVPILLYESLKTLKWPKNKSENLNRSWRTSKNDFCENSADHQFFWRGCANFISAFGRLNTYKSENPSGWHYLLDEPSPEMDSNPNLNAWTYFQSPFQILSLTAVLQTFILKISRTPYYSSSWDVPILLYESLETLK